MDYGLSEFDFWNMTLAEIVRHIESKQRIQKMEAKDKAMFDYVLADLIGKSISRIYSSSATYPTIDEVFPTLFEKEQIEEQKQMKKDELSAIRFRQFAESFNKKFNQEVDKEDG